MERNAINGNAVAVFKLVNLNAIGVVRAHLVQRHQVRHHQEHQRQRQRDDMQCKEAI